MATEREPVGDARNNEENFRELFGNLTLRGDDENNGSGINFDHQEIEVVFPFAAGAELEIDHELERIPDRAFSVLNQSPGTAYKDPAGTEWTDSKIFLKSTQSLGHFIIAVY